MEGLWEFTGFRVWGKLSTRQTLLVLEKVGLPSPKVTLSTRKPSEVDYTVTQCHTDLCWASLDFGLFRIGEWIPFIGLPCYSPYSIHLP